MMAKRAWRCTEVREFLPAHGANRRGFSRRSGGLIGWPGVQIAVHLPRRPIVYPVAGDLGESRTSRKGALLNQGLQKVYRYTLS